MIKHNSEQQTIFTLCQKSEHQTRKIGTCTNFFHSVAIVRTPDEVFWHLEIFRDLEFLLHKKIWDLEFFRDLEFLLHMKSGTLKFYYISATSPAFGQRDKCMVMGNSGAHFSLRVFYVLAETNSRALPRASRSM